MDFDFGAKRNDDSPYDSGNFSSDDSTFSFKDMIVSPPHTDQDFMPLGLDDSLEQDSQCLTGNRQTQDGSNQQTVHNGQFPMSQSKRFSHVMVPAEPNPDKSSPGDGSQISSDRTLDANEGTAGASATGTTQTGVPTLSNDDTFAGLDPNEDMLSNSNNNGSVIDAVEELNLSPNENPSMNYALGASSNTFGGDIMPSTMNDDLTNFSNLRMESTPNSPFVPSSSMTVTPTGTYMNQPNPSRDNSPNETKMTDDDDYSHFPPHSYSNTNATRAILTNETAESFFDANHSFNGGQLNMSNHNHNTFISPHGTSFPGVIPPTSMPGGLPDPLEQQQIEQQQPPNKKWKCRMRVKTKEGNNKSRVETQIPVKLSLFDPPPEIKRVHLPSHTISKPKFQQTPKWEPHPDTLELSCLVFCTSAMQKEGKKEAAFTRGEDEDVPERSEELQNAAKSQDEEDPSKPVNGAPITICNGCMQREKKRHQRKKQNVPDQEDEWMKDEPKRVIVFNCPEVREWNVPDKKDFSTTQQQGQPHEIFFDAPMRIACYCRHQNEKIGFQVLCTLRLHDGEIIAQALSDSIMITDDHKQPPGPGILPGGQYGHGGPLPMFTGNTSYGLMHQGGFPQHAPFRGSLSTNDLPGLSQQYLQQQNIGVHRPSRSGNVSGSVTTANATPRNLSRPASPTGVEGQPGAKKRRSGGPGQHSRMPSGLSMTPADSRRNLMGCKRHSGGGGGAATTPASATGVSFSSPTSANFSSPVDQTLPQNQHLGQFQSGPTTPLRGPTSSFGQANKDNDNFPFYSAPTSQHHSRAPSPNSNARMYQANAKIPDAAATALRNLPQDINMQMPPQIEQVLPNRGPCSGNQMVTIFGHGFCENLEVMFGDSIAPTEARWQDSTLVVRTPPQSGPEEVSVVFRHQHRSPIAALMPAQRVVYDYFDDNRGGDGSNSGGNQTPGQPFPYLLQANNQSLHPFLNHRRNPSGGHLQQQARQQQRLTTTHSQPHRPILNTRGVSGPTPQNAAQMWQQPQSAGANIGGGGGGGGDGSGTQSPQQQHLSATANSAGGGYYNQNILASMFGQPPPGYAPVGTNIGNANANVTNATAAMAAATGPLGTTPYRLQQFYGGAGGLGSGQEQAQNQGQAKAEMNNEGTRSGFGA